MSPNGCSTLCSLAIKKIIIYSKSWNKSVECTETIKINNSANELFLQRIIFKSPHDHHDHHHHHNLAQFGPGKLKILKMFQLVDILQFSALGSPMNKAALENFPGEDRQILNIKH